MKKRTCKKLRFLSRTISLLLILALLAQDALGSGSITLAAMQQEECAGDHDRYHPEADLYL